MKKLYSHWVVEPFPSGRCFIENTFIHLFLEFCLNVSVQLLYISQKERHKKDSLEDVFPPYLALDPEIVILHQNEVQAE